MIYEKNLDISNLSFFERENVKEGKVQIKIQKNEKEKLSFLLLHNYEIINLEDGYLLEKEILEKKSFRISLTENCNYKCFFCHEEGMEMSDQRKTEKNVEDIYEISLEAMKNGFYDITFTGGEPLIKKIMIIELLSRYNKLSIKPDITIVTNGVLVDDSILKAIKEYQGKFKFNFSMHQTQKKKYLDIVLPKDNKENNFDIVCQNIKKIVKNNIHIKLNFVLLNGLNTSRNDLLNILDFGVKYKVNGIKFLEFLVTDKLIDKYKFYFTIESAYNEIEDQLKYKYQNLRTKYYKYNDLTVELSHCTCGIGCSNCILAKDITVTSELKYYPCFFRSSKGFQIEGNFKKTIDQGEQIIKGFAKKYKEKTPFKVSQTEYLSKNEFYYYKILNLKKLLNQIFDKKLVRIREFEERLYRTNFLKGYIKLYKNNHENHYMEVIKKVKLEDNKNISYFLTDEPKKIKNLKEYENYILLLGSELIGVKKINMKYFDIKDNKIAILNVDDKNYISSSKPFESIYIESLNKILEKDIYTNIS